MRADSGFCREDMMAVCEAEGRECVVAHVGHLRTGNPVRTFAEFRWRTLDNWHGSTAEVRTPHPRPQLTSTRHPPLTYAVWLAPSARILLASCSAAWLGEMCCSSAMSQSSCRAWEMRSMLVSDACSL